MRSRKFLFYSVRMGKRLPDIKYCEVPPAVVWGKPVAPRAHSRSGDGAARPRPYHAPLVHWAGIPVQTAFLAICHLGSSCTHRIRPGRAIKHADTDRVVSARSTSQSEPSAASHPPRNSLAIRRPRDDPRSAATSVDTNIIYFSVPVTHSAQITYHASTHPPPP
jgi:hypothetical protein